MNTENKNPKEIQQEIFNAIRDGADAGKLKEDLKAKGVPVEAYYFTTESAHTSEIQQPPSSPRVSGWQVLLTIVAVVILVIRIARCSSKM